MLNLYLFLTQTKQSTNPEMHQTTCRDGLLILLDQTFLLNFLYSRTTYKYRNCIPK
jgi:hypothetical protein